MDKQTLNVAFATQKGGSGKTAITVLVASYLHYNCGCPLAVIDCDFPQHSLYEMRERDSRAVLENEYLKRMAYEQMREPGRAAYPVQKCRVERAPDMAAELADSGNYDLLFFDLPGTVNSSGILRTIAQMDYLRSGECRPNGTGKHARLSGRVATDDVRQGNKPVERALPLLESGG